MGASRKREIADIVDRGVREAMEAVPLVGAARRSGPPASTRPAAGAGRPRSRTIALTRPKAAVRAAQADGVRSVIEKGERHPAA